jgi:hypothetical protein
MQLRQRTSDWPRLNDKALASPVLGRSDTSDGELGFPRHARVRARGRANRLCRQTCQLAQSAWQRVRLNMRVQTMERGGIGGVNPRADRGRYRFGGSYAKSRN